VRCFDPSHQMFWLSDAWIGNYCTFTRVYEILVFTMTIFSHVELLDNFKNSRHINPLDYHVWGAILEKFNKFNPKPKNIEELKRTLQEIWDDLTQASICRAILGFFQMTASLRDSKWRTLRSL